MSLNLDSKIKLRLSWIRKYEELNHAGKVCDHFGISRFTLRKWLKRYELLGIEGLYDLSSRPHNFPNKKVSKEQEEIILDLRKKRKLYQIPFIMHYIAKYFKDRIIKKRLPYLYRA